MLAALLLACAPSLQDLAQDEVASGFQGVMHVERGEEVLLLEAWGEAVEGQVPHTVETVFDVGSLTKQFTAAAVLEARDRGLLSLDDTLGELFEGVPADRAEATVHQLLTHTAGFPDSLGPDEELVERDVYLARAWEAELVDEPGRSFTYSNTGYSLLAAALELRAGQPFEELLRQWLLLPLGMEHTGYTSPDWSAQTVAVGYRKGEPAPALALDGPSWHLVGNGGILSTPGDMRRWLRALHEGEVLSERSREELWAHHVRTWPRAWYAYGWGVEDWMLMGWNVNHDGGNGYFYAHVIWWPDQEAYVAIYSNHARADNDDLAWRLSQAVLR
jgi:CubicO group peptidase (beta-lactamase class C family)